MSLRTKFLNVMKNCAYVQKLGENTFHRYRYATAADVFEKVNAALVEQGIISVARPVILSTEPVTTAKGSTETRVTVEMTVTLTDAATGETMVLTGYGSGQDTGDKAIMKAQTAALKYTWMMSLNISTGDDPEGDAGVDARSDNAAKAPLQASVAVPVTGAPVQAQGSQNVQNPERAAQAATLEQLKVLFSLGRQAGYSDDAMKDWIYKNFNVVSSRDMTSEQASKTISHFKAKLSAKPQAV